MLGLATFDTLYIDTPATMDYKVDLNKPMSPAYIFTRASNMAKNLPPSIQPDQQTEIRVSPSFQAEISS
jgi:hypothetical protein